MRGSGLDAYTVPEFSRLHKVCPQKCAHGVNQGRRKGGVLSNFGLRLVCSFYLDFSPIYFLFSNDYLSSLEVCL